MPTWPAAKLTDTVLGVDIHSVTARLQEMGLSALGALQLLRGQPVTLVADRDMLAKFAVATVSCETARVLVKSRLAGRE
jgi:hypothetical protein